jgi:vesicle-fusing ATPase
MDLHNFESWLYKLIRTFKIFFFSLAWVLFQRKWANLSLNQEVEVKPVILSGTAESIGTITLEVDFLQKKQLVLC